MSNIIGTVGGLIGFVVFLGAAAIYLRGSRDKGTIATLEQNNKALAERVTLLEQSERRLTERVNLLERENERLLLLRPSAEAIADLTAQLTVHDTDTKAGFARLEAKGGRT